MGLRARPDPGEAHRRGRRGTTPGREAGAKPSRRLRVNTNVEALNAHRNLLITGTLLSKSQEKLASGYRINRAADDAAGLAISEKLRSQVTGLQKAVANAQDAISLIQTAEGALTEAHSIVQRMRELAVQASNGTLTTTDRVALDSEAQDLIKELDRIAANTEFNTMKLLNTTAGLTLTFQIGANAAQVMTVVISATQSSDLSVNGLALSTAASASAAIVSLDFALTYISGVRASLGAKQNRLEHTIANLGVAAENLQAADSRIRDVDVALEQVNFTKLMILQQAGIAVLAQANTGPQAVLQLLR